MSKSEWDINVYRFLINGILQKRLTYCLKWNKHLKNADLKFLENKKCTPML